MERDTTLIGTTQAAEIIKRTPQRVRQLIEKEVFTTARQYAKDWLIEKWEVEQYAEQTKDTKRSNLLNSK